MLINLLYVFYISSIVVVALVFIIGLGCLISPTFNRDFFDDLKR